MAAFQTVKGFRDFYPEDCSLRNFLFHQWRATAVGYGFVEYEGPPVEPTDLYRKKSGDEITSQLFCFEDKGGREIALRPEVTPSLARMAAARQRHYTKPMKWFQIGSCFRYEEPQRGRTREFVQFNVDILGEASASADAELIALSIDVMRRLGLGKEDIVIRLSDRRLWTQFLADNAVLEEHHGAFLQIIDKMERAPKEVTSGKLSAIGLSLERVESFIAAVNEDNETFAELRANLSARGLWDFVKIDPGIVRGLAYYTGVVFEVFDLRHNLRAVAGGGRYDNLVGLLSDGGQGMAACGFAMGDVVLKELLDRTPAAQEVLRQWRENEQGLDAYVIIADETKRPDALGLVQKLRENGLRVDYAMKSSKVDKQFKAAEAANARFAAVIGTEYPLLNVKNLRNREQMEVAAADLPLRLDGLLKSPIYSQLIA